MTVEIDAGRPVRLARRNRQGVVLGLDYWQAGSLAIAGAMVVGGVMSGNLLAVVVTSPFWATFALLGMPWVTVHKMSAPRMAVLWFAKQARGALGGTKELYRPERTHLEGTLNLPGIRANVQIWDVDEMAVAYDPIAKTASFTAELEVPGYMMRDTAGRLDLATQWGRVLAPFTQRSGIKRITLQERTQPKTMRAARDFYDHARTRAGFEIPKVVASNYEVVMDTAEPFGVAHRNFLTLTLDLTALSRQIRALGGGKGGVQAAAGIEAGNVADALRAADIEVRSWLSPRQFAALVRTTFDPAFGASVQNRGEGDEGIALNAIGPMYLEEPRGKNGIVLTDTGVHTTMWIHEWPRSAAPVGFVEPVVFARHPLTNEAINHIFTIVLTPVPVEKALSRVQKEKDVWRGNEKLRARRNRDQNAADDADWLALESQEQELVTGHGKFRYGGYLTVTAPTEDDLERAIAGVRNGMARAGMEAQILYCQQAEALLVNALPIGLGMR